MRNESLGLHTYYAPVHSRDIAHAQFPWTFQRYLYDCMHDYLVEMFLRTPQSRETRLGRQRRKSSPPKSGAAVR